MATSDSDDDSIDWLASDDDDSWNSERLSPQQAAESSSSSRESPTSCFHSGLNQSNTSNSLDCRDGVLSNLDALQTPTLSPLQGSTFVCSQQTLPVESQHRSTTKRAHGACVDGLCEKSEADTENEMFTHKCLELQCYIQPLSSILRGLKSGRYSERLSTFQESLAMDRIQRILGVLQNPHMGGRFLQTVLKIEEMLRSWFPHIKPNVPQRDDAPTKKQKHHHSASSSPPVPTESNMEASASSYAHFRHHHTSSSSDSVKTLDSAVSPPCTSLRPAGRRQDVTQDDAVSSSTDSYRTSKRRLPAQPLPIQTPQPGSVSSPCLQRLLQAKDSIIVPRTDGGPGWTS